MLRIRFRANYNDPRPINWPVKHPFWITGSAGDDTYSIVVSYADNEQYIYDNWPEAKNLDVQEVQKYEFSDRFPKPEWLENEVTK